MLPALRRLSPRQATRLLLTPLAKLTEEQRATAAKLLAAAPEVKEALYLSEEFREMLRTQAAEALPAWLAHADRSPMPELTAFRQYPARPRGGGGRAHL